MQSFSAPYSQATDVTKNLLQSQLAIFAHFTEAGFAGTRKLVELQLAAARALMRQSLSEMRSLTGVNRTTAPEQPADPASAESRVEEHASQNTKIADPPAPPAVMPDAEETSVTQQAALDQAQAAIGAAQGDFRTEIAHQTASAGLTEVDLEIGIGAAADDVFNQNEPHKVRQH